MNAVKMSNDLSHPMASLESILDGMTNCLESWRVSIAGHLSLPLSSPAKQLIAAPSKDIDGYLFFRFPSI
jgi:hypothetical protein